MEPTLPSTCAEQRGSHLGSVSVRDSLSHLLPVPKTVTLLDQAQDVFLDQAVSSGLDCSGGHDELVYKGDTENCHLSGCNKKERGTGWMSQI